MRLLSSIIPAIVLASLPELAIAQEAQLNAANTAWILTSTALVLFMTIPGLSLFYAGLVRNKNVLSVLMQCFALTGLMSLLWFFGGYSFAFSGDNPYVGNFDKFMLAGVGMDSMAAGDIPESLFVAFQMTFAVITPALIVGAFAERMKFSAMLMFCSIWLFVVYAPVTHWVWSDNGWLLQKGLIDLAGGTVVHITAAVAALMAALMMGPRKGFPTTAMPPHNMTMVITGAGMLWVGWFGFNAGSHLAANNAAAMTLLVTHISAACGALAWMTMEWLRHGKPSVLGIATGMVAGLGSITPASGAVGPAGAMLIGLTAGVVCYAATSILKQKFKVDDSLDVFPVHGVGGMIGTLSAGVLGATGLGIFSGFGFENADIASQLGVQVTGVLATFIYTAIATLIILKLVDMIVGLRVTPDEETEGLDIVLHDERGYDI
jgi:Amt family ammonium transporter